MQLTPTYDFIWNLSDKQLCPKFRYKNKQYGLYGLITRFGGCVDNDNAIRLTKKHNKSEK